MITIERVNILGMELERWRYGQCFADWGVDRNLGFATLYFIKSENEGKGEATKVLKRAKKFYEKMGLNIRGSIALNDHMRRLYKKLKIKEYG